MLTEGQAKVLNKSEDMKLAVDGLRAVFMSGGKILPKHQRALDALARFCRVGAYNFGIDQVEINRMIGRLEAFNFVTFCLNYSSGERRKLKAQISELEDIRDGRRPHSND